MSQTRLISAARETSTHWLESKLEGFTFAREAGAVRRARLPG